MNRRWRLRLLLSSLVLLLAFGLSIALLHTPPARRWIFTRLQAQLRDSQALLLEAKQFDYNLVVPRFQLDNVSLRIVGAGGVTPFIRAGKVSARLSFWSLLRGSVEVKQVEIEGLALRAVIDKQGRSNLPQTEGASGSLLLPLKLQSALISNLSLSFENQQTPWSVRLPNGMLSVNRNQATAEQGMHYQIQRPGIASWKKREIPIDLLQLNATFFDTSLKLDSLQVVSAGSEVRLGGRLDNVSAPRLDLRGQLKLDCLQLSGWASLQQPISGQLKADLSLTGPLDKFKSTVLVNSRQLSGLGLRSGPVRAELNYDRETQVVELKSLAAELFSGQIGARGSIALGGSRNLSQVSAEFVAMELGQVLPGLGWKGTRLSGKGSVRANAFWPGLEWRHASVAATVEAHRPLAGGADSSLSLLLNTQLSDSGLRLKVESPSMMGMQFEGNLDVDSARKRIAGRFHGQSESLARLTKNVGSWLGRPEGWLSSPPFDGKVEWATLVSGTVKRPVVSVDARATSLSAGKFKDARLDVRASVDPEHIELEDGVLRWHDQQAQGSGKVFFGSKDSAVHLQARFDEISLSKVMTGLGVDVPAGGTFSARASVDGTVAHPALDLKLNGAGLGAYGENLGTLSAQANWKDQTIVLERLRLDKPQEGTPGIFEARGSLNLASREYLFRAAGDNLKASSLRVAGGTLLLGTLQFHAQGRGSLDNPAAELEVEATNLRVSDKQIGEAKGRLQLTGRKMSFHWLVPALKVGGNGEVRLEGSYPTRVEVAAVGSPVSLSRDGLPLVSGSFDLDFKAKGLLTNHEIQEASARLDHVDLTLAKQEIRNGQPIELRYANQRFEIVSLDLTSGKSRFRVTGNLPLKQDAIPGKISVESNLNLDSVNPLLISYPGLTLQGIGLLNAEITGSWEKPRADGTLRLKEGRFQSGLVRTPLDQVVATVHLRDGLLAIEEVKSKLGEGTISATGSLPLTMLSLRFPSQVPSLSAPAQFSIQANQIGISSLISLPEGATGRLSVDIEGEATTLALEAVKARLQFREIHLQQGKFELQQAEPTVLTLNNAELRVERWQWKGPQTQLNVAGSAGLAGEQRLDLQASGNVDASVAAFFAPSLQVSGVTQVSFKAGGTLREPSFSGFLDLEQGSIGLRSPRILADDLKVRVELAGRRVEIKNLAGRLNGGSIQGVGGLTWGHDGLTDAAIELRGQNVFLDYPRGFKTSSAMRLNIKSRGGSLVLGGEVNINEGSYHEPFEFTGEWRDSLKSSGQSGSAVQPASWQSKVLYDLKIQTRQPVEIDNNLARLSASADLRLSGNLQRPGLVGAIDLEQGGKLYFGDRVYFVERGVVTFANESRVDPVFDILATTKVNDYELGLRLSGTTKETKTTFTSDPPLSQNDIISLLLTGKTLAESGGSGRNLTQAGAVSLASGAFSAGLSSGARRVLGISRVSVDPGLIGAESNPGARLTIGQDLTRSLRLVYSMNLVDSSDQIWIAEYDFLRRPTRRLTAKAVKQSDNTYRTELRHDIRFGGRPTQAGRTPQPKAAAGKVGTIQFSGTPLFDEAQLAREFKIKAGASYDFASVRKGIDRLEKLYREQGYLESRVRLQRQEQQDKVNLNVGIEAGKRVKLVYEGMDLSRGTRKQVLKLWQQGVSDSYRSDDSVEAIRAHLAGKGYLQPAVTPRISEPGSDEKEVVFEIRPGIRYRGVKMIFQGVSREREVEISQLLRRRNLTETLYANPVRALDAINRYYLQQGHLQAKIEAPRYELDAEKKTGQLILSISEGPQFHVSALRFEGNKNLADDRLKNGLPMAEGSLFNPIQMEQMVAAIEQKYGQSGFRSPQISYTLHSDEPKAQVSIKFAVTENLRSVVQSISVSGEDQTSEAYIRQQLLLRQGGVYDASQVNDSISKLYRTGAFSRVDLQAKVIEDAQTKPDGKEPVAVAVTVQEPKPLKFVYGGLYDSDRGLGVTADVENRNTLGSARVLGLRTRYNRSLQEGRMYFSQPTWQRSPLETTATLFVEQEKFPDLANSLTWGLTLQQELPLAQKFRLSYGYQYKKVLQTQIEDPSLALLSGQRVTVAPLVSSFTRDVRDSFLDATRGSFISNAFEFAPEFLGTTYGYVRYFGQYFKYFPLSKPQYVPFEGEVKRARLVYASGFRVGLIKAYTDEAIVLTDRFFAGGGTTVRGFKQDELGPKNSEGTPVGGNAMFINNNEIRFPFISIVDGVGFLDIGNVYSSISDFKFSELRKTAGFGLRLRTPFVLLRFDYGFKLDRQPGESRGAFFFSIGQAF